MPPDHVPWAATAPSLAHASLARLPLPLPTQAGLYLRVVRELEGTKSQELQNLGKLIGIQRLKSSGLGGASGPPKDSIAGLKLDSALNSLARKAAAPVIALFVTLPCETALYLDERAECAAKNMTVQQMGGDPGFLINGMRAASPPLRAPCPLLLSSRPALSSLPPPHAAGPPLLFAASSLQARPSRPESPSATASSSGTATASHVSWTAPSRSTLATAALRCHFR